MKDSVLKELKDMVKHPIFLRRKIHNWITNGLLLKYMDTIEDEELKEQLKDLYKKEFENLSTDNLMTMYSKLSGRGVSSAKKVLGSLQKNLVGVAPSKRGKD